MSDKSKLAAGRRMLEEYKKKQRNNSVGSIQPRQESSNKNDQAPPATNVYFPPATGTSDHGSSNVKNPFKDNDDAHPISNFDQFNPNSIDNDGSIITSQMNVGFMSNEAVGNVTKTDDHYVARLVSELTTHPVSANNGSIEPVQDVATSEMKSAKDFFDNLPVSNNSNSDLSFNLGPTSTALFPNNSASTTQMQTMDFMSSGPSSHVPSAINSEAVPLFSDVTENYDSAFKCDYQDEKSDQSESVPVTPSDQEESSSSDQHSRQISTVLEIQLRELDIRLGAEFEKNKKLQEDLQKSENTITKLEKTVEAVRNEKEIQEKALEEKLKYHVTTLEILIAEKTELQTALTTCQESISQKAGEMEELQGRLRASRHRVGDLERKLALAQTLQQQHEKSAHEATIVSDTLKQEVNLMRKRLDETEEEILSLKHKVEMKSREIEGLQNDLKEKVSQLSVAELRVQQLSDPNNVSERKTEDETVKLQEQNKRLELRIAEMNIDLKRLSNEKDDASLQFQQYVASLNLQMQSLNTELQTISNQRDSLSAREASLVEHVSNLEKQLQQTQQRKLSPPLIRNGELEKVNKQLLEVTSEKQVLSEQLEKEVSEKNTIFEALQLRNEKIEELERSLERLESDRPDVSRLQAAIESDKVAASRAVAQNNDLKKQLEELQDAFIKLSNNKLELTELLGKEQHINKELQERLAGFEISKENETHSHGKGDDYCDHSDSKPETVDFCSQTYNIKDNNDPGIVIDIEAMAKLEEKFKRKMQEVADLSDEKQRLEHLVMQLQGETETIGEYIALYQIQRGMLRQRAQEKDEQMARLARERELMRHKLKELKSLVRTMVPSANLANKDHFFKDSHSAESSDETERELNDSPSRRPLNGVEENKEETVEKIQALLSEIGSSTLVTSDHGDDPAKFHSCPLCSGRPLITV